jgi:hypothetical protein
MKAVKIISVFSAIITVVLSAFGSPDRSAFGRTVSASMSDEVRPRADQNAPAPAAVLRQQDAGGNILERFKLSKLAKPVVDKDQVPPLVKEARAFALYLNPPPTEPPPKPVMPANQTPGLPGLSVGPRGSSSQFKLIATCVSQSNPQLSLALIDLPGEGFKWVRQSAMVGYLVINEIKDGSLVVQDSAGGRFSVLIEATPQQVSLVKGKSPLSSAFGGPTPIAPLFPSAFTTVETDASPAVRLRRISGQDGSAATQIPAQAAWMTMVENQQSLTTEEQASVQKFMNELDAIIANSGDDEAALEESLKQADELAKKYFPNIDGAKTIGQDAPKQNDETGKLDKPKPDTNKPNLTRRQPTRRRPGFPSPPKADPAQ